MDEGTPEAAHWAVLIGINFYVEPLKPLMGCVRDVASINQYLDTGSMPVHVEKFTASTPSEPSSRHPIEKPESWPTFENVTSSLAKIIAKGKPRDFVYIHYSGHGTQKEATSSEYSNKNTGDLALVLFDEIHGSRYLRGLELAHLLNQMVKNGLFVTLVLDCCFSGSTIRHGDPNGVSIRSANYDSAIDTTYPQTLGMSPTYQVHYVTLRNAHVQPHWLVDPDGYTILTACGPHEKSYELKFEGESRSGALSYFLLRALISLRNSGVDITHQSLHQHLCARFHASWPKQNPMRYGNDNLTFFGKLNSGPKNTFISVFKTQKDSRICLEAGYAHGVYKDDQYALYPFDSPEDISSNAREASIKVRVDHVRGLTSDLVEIEPKLATSQVKTGWKARPLTHLSPRKVFVRIMALILNQSEWILAADQRRFLHPFTEGIEGQPCLFNVTCNARNEYEILDESCQKILSLPTVPLNMKGALDCTLDILEHLATFKYIEGIENRLPTPSFDKSFTIKISGPSGEIFDVARIFNIKHNDMLNLEVQNDSDKPLYLHIYNLGPSWQISSLIADDGGGDYTVVLPKNDTKQHTGREEMAMQMTVPGSFTDRGQYQCEDIVKIFITSKPSSFSALELPKIPIDAGGSNGPLRGDHNRLSEFLSGLATPFRGPEAHALDEEWVTREFVLRTVAEKP